MDIRIERLDPEAWSALGTHVSVRASFIVSATRRREHLDRVRARGSTVSRRVAPSRGPPRVLVLVLVLVPVLARVPVPVPVPVPDFARQSAALSEWISGPSTEVAVLDHEQLDVYRCAIQFVAIAVRVTDAMPKANAALADQLRRAAISIPPNIAEGSGRPKGPDRARFRAMARGSALECAAVLDVCRELGLAGADLVGPGKELLERIVAMPTRLCQ